MEKMTIRDLHRVEKPREKLARYGAERLSDVELLAILLGFGKKGLDVLSLSQNILTTFSPDKLVQADLPALRAVPGIGSAKASIIIAALEFAKRVTHPVSSTIITPLDVWNSLHDIRTHTKEHFVVFLLNARNQLIKQEIISIGIVDSSIVHPREVFEPAIRHVASSIVIAHNHPSGEVNPSDADIAATAQLSAAGKVLGIPVADHVIVAREAYFSFVAHGML